MTTLPTASEAVVRTALTRSATDRTDSGRSGSTRGRRTGLRLLGAACAAVAVLSTVSAPAQAATSLTSCGLRTTNTVLASLGDTSQYYLANGGSFEFGQIPWLLTNASTVTGNEPWRVVPGFNTTSLRIGPGGSASSGYDCNATGEDSLRFFYRSPGIAGATLRVTIGALSASGFVYQAYVVSGAGGGWALSQPLAVPNQRGLVGAQIVTFSFATTGTAAPWQIDDVVVDPWRTL
jgi:hypothetical protein